ncbi:hypothetical protein [Porphyromonas pogonae]
MRREVLSSFTPPGVATFHILLIPCRYLLYPYLLRVMQQTYHVASYYS